MRITIENIWRHPFLNKYNDCFGYGPEASKMEFWIGPHPRIDEWDPLDRNTIDRDIFRNLRTLWHSDREETLIAKLMNLEYVSFTLRGNVLSLPSLTDVHAD